MSWRPAFGLLAMTLLVGTAFSIARTQPTPGLQEGECQPRRSGLHP
ncbi:MAG: hypothetical protein R3F54_30465 [Alphaproteobacteria bacterium]